MSQDWISRTQLLIGDENIERLRNAHVLIAGLGGVGAFAAEMVCRAGVGKMTILDGDEIIASNRNRQLLALSSVEGQRKATLMAHRLLDINPDLDLVVIDDFLRDEKTGILLSNHYDYVIDAIDTLAPKVFLIYETMQRGLKLVSSMGAGGKINPALVQIADVADSHSCKLAYFIRKRLHHLGIRTGFKVVFSPEPVSRESKLLIDNEQNKKSTVGTISYMPAIFGCQCASVAIRDIIGGA
nr:tRNA threonylcarbamoyladenosine dehydratase [Bacteroidota bacterium]